MTDPCMYGIFYLHEWLISMENVNKYTSPIDPMWSGSDDFSCSTRWSFRFPAVDFQWCIISPGGWSSQWRCLKWMCKTSWTSALEYRETFWKKHVARWWFQTFFIFISIWGNDPIWLITRWGMVRIHWNWYAMVLKLRIGWWFQRFFMSHLRNFIQILLLVIEVETAN